MCATSFINSLSLKTYAMPVHTFDSSLETLGFCSLSILDISPDTSGLSLDTFGCTFDMFESASASGNYHHICSVFS